MTAKVVSLQSHVNPDALEAARELLRRVETGEVQAVAAAMVLQSGETCCHIAGTEKAFGQVSVQSLLGSIARMEHRLHTLMDAAMYETT